MPNIVEILVKSRNETKTGFDAAESSARKVGDTADQTGARIAGLGTKIAAAGAAAATGLATAAAGIGKALYNVGSTMDEMQDKIRVGTGASGAALDGLVGSAKRVGTSVPSDFGSVGDAIAALSQRLNITGKPLEDLATQFLNLSRITGTDVKTNIESLTRVFGDWGISTDQQADTLDKMFRVSQTTGVGIDRLAQNVVKFGAPLRQMGFSFEESIAMLGKFEKEGVNSELVMGSMRIALGKIAKGSQDAGKASLEAEKAQKAYNDAVAKHGAGSLEARTAQEALSAAQSKGALAGKDAAAVFTEYVQKIKDAGSATEANALALELFGARAGPDMAAAIREGRLSVDELVASINKGSDTINKASLETMDFAEQWQLTKNRLMVAFEPAAAKVFGAIGEAMEQNGPKIAAMAENIGPLLVTAIEAMISVLTTAAPIIQAVLTVLAALGPAAGPVVLAIGGIAGAFKAVNTAKGVLDLLPDQFAKVAVSAVANFGKMGVAAVGYAAASVAGAAAATAAWVAANIAMIAATGGVILIIGAVIAAIVLLVKNWDWVKEKAAAVWSAVAGFFKAMGSAIVDAVSLVINWVKENWKTIIAVIMGPLGILIGLVVQNWDKIKAIFRAGVDAVIAAVRLLAALPGIVIGYVSGMVSGAINKAGELVGWFKSLPGKLVGALGDLGRMLGEVGWDIIQGIWRGLQRGWNWLVDQVRNLARSLLDAAKQALGISSPSKAFEKEFGAMIPPGAGAGVSGAARVAIEAVRRMAEDMLSTVPRARAVPMGAVNATVPGQARPIVLEFKTNGSSIEELLMSIIRRYIRVNGGDVQAVLGRS